MSSEKTSTSVREIEKKIGSTVAGNMAPNKCSLSIHWNLESSNSKAQCAFRGYKKLHSDPNRKGLISRLVGHPSSLSISGNELAEKLANNCMGEESWKKFCSIIMDGNHPECFSKSDFLSGSNLRSMRSKPNTKDNKHKKEIPVLKQELKLVKTELKTFRKKYGLLEARLERNSDDSNN